MYIITKLFFFTFFIKEGLMYIKTYPRTFLHSFWRASPTTAVFILLFKSIIRSQLKNRSSISSNLILLDMKWHWPHTQTTKMHRKRRTGSDSSQRTQGFARRSESFCSFKRWAKQCCGLLTSKSIAKTA